MNYTSTRGNTPAKKGGSVCACARMAFSFSTNQTRR